MFGHRKPNLTLRDVADAAGVSVSTASRALNGRAKQYRISVQTEERVRVIAKRLRFQPSQMARSFRSRRSGLIGIVVPDLSNPFFSYIARQITLSAEKDGYSALLADSRDTTSHEQRLVSELQSRQIEALVVCPVGSRSEHLEIVHRSGLPMVLVDRCFPGKAMVQVTSDHRGGANRVVKLLIDRGHERIGAIQGRPGTLPNQQRLDGLKDALADAGIEFGASLVAGDSFGEASGYEATHQLLEDHPDITALFSFGIPNALGALRAANECGRQVPEGLSIVTFDDLPSAEFMRAPITAAAQDIEKIGRIAAELIAMQLRSGKRPRKRMHRIDVQIIERASVTEACKA